MWGSCRFFSTTSSFREQSIWRLTWFTGVGLRCYQRRLSCNRSSCTPLFWNRTWNTSASQPASILFIVWQAGARCAAATSFIYTHILELPESNLQFRFMKSRLKEQMFLLEVKALKCLRKPMRHVARYRSRARSVRVPMCADPKKNPPKAYAWQPSSPKTHLHKQNTICNALIQGRCKFSIMWLLQTSGSIV